MGIGGWETEGIGLLAQPRPRCRARILEGAHGAERPKEGVRGF